MSEQHPSTEPAIRRTIFFSGNVQGVGFRYSTSQMARDFAVSGTVRNLLDGRVEVVAEGLPAEVDDFVAKIEETMQSYIEHTTCSDSTARDEFKSFNIRY
jgi:acylphosphatase